MLQKILIANRGEIAVRIIRACAEMGIISVAVYSEADRHALHVKKADEAHSLGDDPLAGYLNPHKLVNLALETGCDAIHPGYGFLSENAQFAEICARRGIQFIGPDADIIRRMGDKTEARALMQSARVPVVPGSEGNLKDVDEALTLAGKIGYPVMLKATSGGGGRGIRRCNDEAELKRNYERVVSEATKAFGSAEVFLEKCIVNPRHIEVQILADRHGNAIHLFERDCSIQRRNQKLIEIAPSPQLTEEQRRTVCELAVKATLAAGYEN
ncbi:MAG: ATP-grasp domain-containing protein, partial [Methylothermaceae bacterium]|nr:ATP-grasp domain-containing protein [Methylothermaceae bacterium]